LTKLALLLLKHSAALPPLYLISNYPEGVWLSHRFW
jgi:hypothetical protein